MTIRVALVKDNKVENVIVAENLELIRPLFPLDKLVEQTEETFLAWIGARWNGTRFESPKKFDSWTWDEDSFDYLAPSKKPKGEYFWNESVMEWRPISEMVLSPIERGLSEAEILAELEAPE